MSAAAKHKRVSRLKKHVIRKNKADLTSFCSWYRGANGMISLPIGAYPIRSKNPKIKNWNFSELMEGHNVWKQELSEVLSRIDASERKQKGKRASLATI